MKKSPLNASPYQGRQNYNKWNSKPRGYGYAKSVSPSNQTWGTANNNDGVPGSGDFIPLSSLSFPAYKTNDHCWQQQQQQQQSANFSTRNNRNNSMGYNHHRNANNNNCLSSPKSHYGYSPYKQSGKFYQGQNKNFQRGGHRQTEISRYIDLKSIFEDPWADLNTISDKYGLLTSFNSSSSQESKSDSAGSSSFDEKAQESGRESASASFNDSSCTSRESKDEGFEESRRSQSLSPSPVASSI